MNKEQVLFNPAELLENQQKKERLFGLIESGECILMAGAGCSGKLFKSWGELMQFFSTEAKLLNSDFVPFDPKVGDYLEFADRVKECLGESNYYFAIFEAYNSQIETHKKFHEVLCSLPFKGITTTNYDRVLENALLNSALGQHRADNSIWISKSTEPAKIFEFLTSLNDKNKHRSVFHIHGVCDQKESIILSAGEYKEKYGFSHKPLESTLYQDIKDGNVNESDFERLLFDHGLKWTPHRKILWALLATRRVLFLGFSMDDPYFNKMLESVSEDLHTYNISNHYLVLRTTLGNKTKNFDRAKLLKKKFGIETIFFEDDETYQGLERFIDEMNENIKRPISDANLLMNELIAVQKLGKDRTTELLRISRNRNDHDH